MPASTFQPEPDETVYYRTQPFKARLALAWRLFGGVLLVLLFGFLSVTAFSNVANEVLTMLLPRGAAQVVSEILCIGLTPLLVVLWFVEDTLQTLTSELVLTDRRIWMKRSPYFWSPDRTIPLAEIRSIRQRRDGIFIYLNSSRKPQVHLFPDGKKIVQIYEQIHARTTGG